MKKTLLNILFGRWIYYRKSDNSWLAESLKSKQIKALFFIKQKVLMIINLEKMKKGKNILRGPTAAILLTILATYCSAQSSPPGIRRTELQRHDLANPGREVVQTRIDFDEGITFGKHHHPGEEIVYVIEGLLEYQVEG